MKTEIQIKKAIKLLQDNVSQLLDSQLKAETTTDQVFYKELIDSEKLRIEQLKWVLVV
ncbi:hypothetical protein [Maribacter sp.]|uniref:hypothetical protein n=1 Tax=Maribacter sp. TaxID=1897614 RepID=UPI0025B86986|nr:hypothetical protein [Maribacter sp.]